ncbi:hypothetical protein PFISCL1PPCAC_5407, partial [Pristionchus fissidentatus]
SCKSRLPYPPHLHQNVCECAQLGERRLIVARVSHSPTVVELASCGEETAEGVHLPALVPLLRRVDVNFEHLAHLLSNPIVLITNMKYL